MQVRCALRAAGDYYGAWSVMYRSQFRFWLGVRCIFVAVAQQLHVNSHVGQLGTDLTEILL